MTTEDVERFVKSKATKLTIIGMKDEGDFGNGYVLYQCGYVKELTGLIVEVDSWKEEDLIEEIRTSYEVMKMYNEREGVRLPDINEFEVEYVDKTEWISKQ